MTDEALTTAPPPSAAPLTWYGRIECACCKASPVANPAGMRPSNMSVYNKHGIVAQNGVVTLSVALLNDMLDAAREEGRQGAGVIPPGVYYSAGNFYDAATRIGMGAQFWERWRHRRDEFPEGPADPGEPTPDWILAS